MNNIYDLYPRYCLACENKDLCWENHWSITMDKDGKRCDNFKILEDNTEEIEELPDYNYSIKENRDKINELVRAVNKLRKEKNEQ